MSSRCQGVLEGLLPSQQDLAGHRLVSGWKIIYLPFVFCFFFLRKQQQQKQAENENLTSGQARILFWKREVCVLFSTWPSKSLAIVEPGDT